MGKDSYFYAGGKQIPLKPDPDHFAVDIERASSGDVEPLAPAILEKARELRQHLYLVERSAVPAGVEERLEEAGALHPVFEYQDSLLIVLPEVRVEVATEKISEVQHFLEKAEIRTQIVKDRGNRLVLRPDSGRGVDALRLANDLQEKGSVEMAEARFLRMVPKRHRT